MAGSSGLIYLTTVISNCLFASASQLAHSGISYNMSSTQITTTVQSQVIHKPRFLRLVGSSSPITKVASQHDSASPSLSPDNSRALFQQQLPETYQHQLPLHTSFDFDSEYLPSQRQITPKISPSQTWLRRKYYQYEVTWGLYVLTPGEKVVINSLVLSMLALVLYGTSQIALLRYAWYGLWSIVSRVTPLIIAISRALESLALHSALVWVDHTTLGGFNEALKIIGENFEMLGGHSAKM
jgi:hypothetical protein